MPSESHDRHPTHPHDDPPAHGPAEPFHRHAQRVIVAAFGLFLGIMLARGFHF
jgi:hypothetical protein